jgi:hypothetical protein
VQRVWGNEPSYFQVNSHCGSYSPKWTPKSLMHNFKGQNPSIRRVLYIIGKYWNVDKMGLHDSFGHLKHKLWSKERPWVKLAIWLPTTKSWESTRFPPVQVVCDIPLESSQRGLWLCLRPHCNPRFAREIMRPQSCKSHNCETFGSPTWEF